MKVNLKKYFVTVLALLLVLSNFSFAASYTICKMNKAGFTCMCDDGNKDKTSRIGLSENENSCCKKQIKEISNTNNLISFKPDIKHYTSSSLIAVINPINHSRLNSLHVSKYNHLDERIPPPDITITTSALRI